MLKASFAILLGLLQLAKQDGATIDRIVRTANIKLE